MQYDKINMMLPTRGRANGLLKKHFDSVLAFTKDFDKICYTILIDQDDKETVDWFYKKSFPFNCHFLFQKSDSPHLSMFYNRMYQETLFKNNGTLVSMVGDDMQWRTEGYEERILDAVNQRDGVAVVCCDDGFHHSHKRFVNMFTTRKVVDATAKLYMCPMFPADYIDDMWWKISEGIGATVWLDEVVCYHDHASRRPQADRDLTCQRLRAVVGDSRRNLSAIDPWVNECVANIKKSGLLCTK